MLIVVGFFEIELFFYNKIYLGDKKQFIIPNPGSDLMFSRLRPNRNA